MSVSSLGLERYSVAYAFRRVGGFRFKRAGPFFGLSVSRLLDDGLVNRFFFLVGFTVCASLTTGKTRMGQ